MARPASQHPTELELQILKVLWRDGPAPVRHVRDALAPARDLAYTSVMTVMNIMADKGYLRRDKPRRDDTAPGGGGAGGTAYVYTPLVSEQSTTRGMLKDLVDRAFDGSASAVMLNLIESGDIDDEELKQLRQIIARKAKGERP